MPTKQRFVADLVPGQPVSDVFLLAEARLGQAKNGPFWTLLLEDVTGGVEAKVWSPTSQAYPDLRPGLFLAVAGQVGSYRDKTQVNVERLDILSPEDFTPDMADFVASSARPPEELLNELEELLKTSIGHAPWRRFCRKALAREDIRSKLLDAPGAKNVHHSYRGGLLEHTLAVCRLVCSICALYPALDKDTLLAAAAFHDLGKAWELTSGPARDYTDEGRLLGHIVIGLELLDPILARSGVEPELVLHFKHILVSHHGELEFGSPRRPKTSEAFILHFADNIDAKMNQIFGTFVDGEPGTWSPFVRTLERYLYNPARSPRPEPDKKPKDKDDGQCLLPLKA